MKKESWEKELEELFMDPGVSYSLDYQVTHFPYDFSDEYFLWFRELKSFIRRLLEKQKEEFSKVIQKRLDYCRRKNGLPYCKNCGLGKGDLEKLKNR